MIDFLTLNVNDHTETKGKFSYLSWSWAWAEVLKEDPQASWVAVEYLNAEHVAQPCMWLPDGTAIVKVQVTIKGDTKAALLPVMNAQNHAIKNPDAFAINTAIMRCMAKACAMFGLGLYIYAGEDVPEGEVSEPKPSKPRPPAPQSKPIEQPPAASPEAAALNGIRERVGDRLEGFTPAGDPAPVMPSDEDRARYQRGLDKANGLNMPMVDYETTGRETKVKLMAMMRKLGEDIKAKETANQPVGARA